MTAVDLQGRLVELSDLVDTWLREELRDAVQPPAERFGAMLGYHLGWRDADLTRRAETAAAGKRLRPALTLLVSEAVCGSLVPARQAALAVELIHNFSLVHDDIQDRSQLRRHRRTVWSLWGMPQGINAGDALFTLAQIVILRDRTASSAAQAALLNEVCLRLVEGQYLDLELQGGGARPTLPLYEEMIARKTGALFEGACRLGALAAGASVAEQAAYAAYGRTLGIAFQEQDDILGVWGNETETGKPFAADVVERKKGLPATLALSRPDAPEWLHDAYAAVDEPLPPAVVARVIQHFDALDLRAQVEARVECRFQEALAALGAASGREPARSHLAAVGETLRARRA